MSDYENESVSETEEITDLSNPAVVLKYKTAAEIVNKSLKGVLTQVGKAIPFSMFLLLKISEHCFSMRRSPKAQMSETSFPATHYTSGRRTGPTWVRTPFSDLFTISAAVLYFSTTAGLEQSVISSGSEVLSFS